MDAYLQIRKQYGDRSGSLLVTASTDDTTLKASRGANHTLYIQKIIVMVTGGNATSTWQFKDSAGTPIKTAQLVDAATAHQETFDFGPDGIPLTAAKDFLLDVTNVGASGQIKWYAYEKLSSTINTGTSPALS